MVDGDVKQHKARAGQCAHHKQHLKAGKGVTQGQAAEFQYGAEQHRFARADAVDDTSGTDGKKHRQQGQHGGDRTDGHWRGLQAECGEREIDAAARERKVQENGGQDDAGEDEFQDSVGRLRCTRITQTPDDVRGAPSFYAPSVASRRCHHGDARAGHGDAGHRESTGNDVEHQVFEHHGEDRCQI